MEVITEFSPAYHHFISFTSEYCKDPVFTRLNLCSYLNTRDKVLHPYNNEIMILYV
jgi:hypothetical protein